MDNNKWFEDTDWFDDNDWLLGGFLLIDLEFNCVRIIDSRDCMMTRNNEGEIVIPFSLLDVEPKGMSREMLSNLIERKIRLRFYFMACYTKIYSML